MKLWLEDPDLTLWQGDVLDVLEQLDSDSVDCVVTSPPYWGLRDYGTGTWEGGDPDCDHAEKEIRTGQGLASWSKLNARGGGVKAGEVDVIHYAERCGRCGAERLDRQLGLEPSPILYLERMVAVFREVRRVLASHGVCWLNIGDSYASKPRGSDNGWENSRLRNPARIQKAQAASMYDSGLEYRGAGSFGTKEKDLMLMPARLAIALQDDGWWVRSDVIWSKPNPMPESVTNRPTKAHEYVYLLTKSGRPHYWHHVIDGRLVDRQPKPDWWWFPPPGVEAPARPDTGESYEGWRRLNAWEGHDYHFDQDAVREPFSENLGGRQRAAARGDDRFLGSDYHNYYEDGRVGRFQGGEGYELEPPQAETLGDLPGERPRGADGRRKTTRKVGDHSHENHENADGGERWPQGGRNIRSVWSIPTRGYPGAHFATFPPELVRRAIEAGCATEVCEVCGKPRTRLLEVAYERNAAGGTVGYQRDGDDLDGRSDGTGWAGKPRLNRLTAPRGWSDCGHDSYRPGRVLDPFAGSGTTGAVARELGRHAVLIELNPDYCDMIEQRTHQLSLLAEPG